MFGPNHEACLSTTFMHLACQIQFAFDSYQGFRFDNVDRLTLIHDINTRKVEAGFCLIETASTRFSTHSS